MKKASFDMSMSNMVKLLIIIITVLVLIYFIRELTMEAWHLESILF